MPQKIGSPFTEISQHILLPWAAEIPSASAIAHLRLSDAVFTEILAAVPDEWLKAAQAGADPQEVRTAYIDFFVRRLAASPIFEEEAIRAHARLV
jgi:hypothetical protein